MTEPYFNAAFTTPWIQAGNPMQALKAKMGKDQAATCFWTNSSYHWSSLNEIYPTGIRVDSGNILSLN